MAVTMHVRVDESDVAEVFGLLRDRMRNLRPLMRDIGEIVRDSVMENFRSQSSPGGIAWKRSQRAQRQGGVTLVDSGILKNSVGYRESSDRVAIGTSMRYAAVHQFGAGAGSFGTVDTLVREHMRRSGKTGRQHSVRAHSRRQTLPWGDIPARPYLGIKHTDWPEIHRAIMVYLTEVDQ